MSSIAVWIGVLILGLGAIFSLLSAIHTLQSSRRWSDYRLRRRYIVQARGSVLLSVLSGALAVGLLLVGRSWQRSATPAAPPPTPTFATETAVPPAAAPPTETTTGIPASPPTETPAPTETATVFVASATPVIPPTIALTATPAMPIAVQALIQGTGTPAFAAQFGRLRFSTEINNYTLVAPGEEFQNPIKQMYSVFTYQPVGVKIQWTALWYQNAELKYVDTTSWQDFPAGVAVAVWRRPAPEWKPGQYEVQIFVGTEWKASGRFALEGEPPTVTPSPLPSSTPTALPTSTITNTPSITPTWTASPQPPPTRTPRPSATASSTAAATATPTNTETPQPRPTSTLTSTITPRPSSTLPPSSTPSKAPSLTPLPTLTPTSTPTRPTSTPEATKTPRPSATPVPSNTPSKTPSATPLPTFTPTITPTLPPVEINVFFTNTRPSGTRNPPFNEPVRRMIPGSANSITAALDAYFAGPTSPEQAQGLIAIRNGFVGYRRVDFTDGVLSVYLAGNCQPGGMGYGIAQPLIATLKQFPGVLYVKVYDAYDHTGDAIGPADSWPVCLDVIFTSTYTPSPTSTATHVPSKTPTPTASPVPTRTPVPTSSFTPAPSSTPQPTLTPTPVPSRTPTLAPTSTPPATKTPIPTATSTPRPTSTPPPTFTATFTRTPSVTPSPTITRTPTSTFTPGPTNTPRPTLTLTPINAPTQAGTGATAPRGTVQPTPTLDVACYRAEFLGDVTIVDDALLRPNQPFRKTWRVRNAGNCPWTAAYQLIFVRGEHMGGPTALQLEGPVAAGQNADLSVDLIAPARPGQYEGFWQLQSPDGQIFGIGPGATGNLWVKIRVAGEPLPTSTGLLPVASPTAARPTGWAEATLTAFAASATAEAAPTTTATPIADVTSEPLMDFADLACAAQWQANDGVLGCPGQPDDPRGSVTVLSEAALEDGPTVTQPALLTIPSTSADGYILGLYPQYKVAAGDHLRAGVGCEYNALQCSVLFRVSYLDEAGAARDLWTLGEFYDGHHFDLDLDLSDLAGQQVRIVLSVGNLGNAAGDRALWIAPRIVNTSAPTATLPTDTPAPILAVTSTPTIVPTPTTAVPSPTPTVPAATPTAPIPSFFNSIIEFFRQLFAPK